MLPIPIYVGSELYLLVRAGTPASRSGAVEPKQARALLEAALRRRDPLVIRLIAEVLHMRGEDPEAIVTRALTQLAAGGPGGATGGTGGLLGGELVLVHVAKGEFEGERLKKEEELEEEQRNEEAEEKEEEPPPRRITIRVSLFFDGTLNNRANTMARREAEVARKEFSKTGSYENDESNVSRLEMLCKGDPSFTHSFPIYVEGIGTLDGKGDALWGKALGALSTGIKGKVKVGVQALLDGIKELGVPRGTIIERFELDTFGFSRGAAAARNCVYHCLTEKPLKPRIEALGYPVESFEVNFVGLFDTVASHGVKHSNDTDDLHLKSITSAKKVLQLAAAEEHRAKFRLTDIRSVAGGIGVELYLPGVHSDIGGGYVDNGVEKDLQILDFDVLWSTKKLEQRFEKERKWLIRAGWYKPGEISKVNFWNELKVNRTGISNKYTRIPMRIMSDFATETGLVFDDVATRFPAPQDLKFIEGLIDAHVAAHRGGGSTANFWIKQESEPFRQLRHKYLHFSAYYNFVNNPQFTNDDPMYGERERVVQAG